MRTIGILGGMGPEATILLMQRVLVAVPATDDADHVPLIVHQNPQVPSRIAALIDGGGADPAPVLARMARDLNAFVDKHHLTFPVGGTFAFEAADAAYAHAWGPDSFGKTVITLG